MYSQTCCLINVINFFCLNEYITAIIYLYTVLILSNKDNFEDFKDIDL